MGDRVGIPVSQGIGERNNREVHGEHGGSAQPTEKTLGKALMSPLQQDLGELPAFVFRLSRDRTKLTALVCRQDLLGSIEADSTNRVISPCYLDISPSAATAVFRVRRQPVRLNRN
jgi:hypothetical protein